jgi:hypothetical protein
MKTVQVSEILFEVIIQSTPQQWPNGHDQELILQLFVNRFRPKRMDNAQERGECRSLTNTLRNSVSVIDK